MGLKVVSRKNKEEIVKALEENPRKVITLEDYPNFVPYTGPHYTRKREKEIRRIKGKWYNFEKERMKEVKIDDE